ncbi:MAG: DUF3565 domain-containing protein [Granulosicoccaceae bacterium]
MQQAIAGFHTDELNDWVADLACGHTQHVRHNPPWQNRPWVETAESRQEMLGSMLECKLCDPVDGDAHNVAHDAAHGLNQQ